MKLNLTATNIPEERIKTYLEENASPTLAEKINFGTPITKDGKPLINRKTLAGFFKYATEEARKLATKNTIGAYVDDDTVFGWSIHYFEEEAIIGELFNLDGTPYKAEKAPAPKATPKAPSQKPKTEAPAQPKEAPKAEPKKATILPTPEPKPTKKNTATDQMSIFDLF